MLQPTPVAPLRALRVSLVNHPFVLVFVRLRSQTQFPRAVDVWSFQLYRGNSFGQFFDEYQQVWLRAFRAAVRSAVPLLDHTAARTQFQFQMNTNKPLLLRCAGLRISPLMLLLNRFCVQRIRPGRARLSHRSVLGYSCPGSFCD